MPETTTGELRYTGRAPLGNTVYDWWECIDCETTFPQNGLEGIKCNHARIDRCPWCRPDSKPWANGRGN